MNEDRTGIVWIATVTALLSALFLIAGLAFYRFMELLIGDQTWLWGALFIIPLTIFCIAYWIERFTAK